MWRAGRWLPVRPAAGITEAVPPLSARLALLPFHISSLALDMLSLRTLTHGAFDTFLLDSWTLEALRL